MTFDANQVYQKIFKQGRYIHTLQGMAYLLDWDQETYMPEGAADFRAEQIKALAGLIHKKK